MLTRILSLSFWITIQFPACVGGNWNDVKNQYVLLYDAYSLNNDAYVDTIPRSNTDSPKDVTLAFNLYSFSEYDAVAGALEIVGSLSMVWTDEIATLKTIAFSTSVTDEIVVDYRTIWTPVIVLVNSADSVERIGDESYKVRFSLSTGQATWSPRMILRASCSPDVTFFPFDEQKCVLTFTPWFSDITMVRLLVSSDTWNTDQYEGSGVWKVKTTTATAYESGDYYYADFTITFSREPVYFTINIVLPVLLLSLLSGFVFLLPAVSGERIGFAITCFLSFVVLLQTMMKFLPEASAPMSLFCYYVIVMMLFSGFVGIVTTLLLRIHHKNDGEVWKWLVHTIEVITCVKCKRLKLIKKIKQINCKWLKKNSVEDSSRANSAGSGSQIVERVNENGNLIGNGKGNMPLRITFNSKRVSNLATSVETAKTDNKKNLKDAERGKSEESCDTEEELSDLSWEDVCRILDLFFFLAFIGVQVAFSIFFLVPLGSRA